VLGGLGEGSCVLGGLGEGSCVLGGFGEGSCVLESLLGEGDRVLGLGEGDCALGDLIEPVRKSPLGGLWSPIFGERPAGEGFKRLIEPARESPPVLCNLW
jgi:hypothetical protein